MYIYIHTQTDPVLNSMGTKFINMVGLDKQEASALSLLSFQLPVVHRDKPLL